MRVAPGRTTRTQRLARGSSAPPVGATAIADAPPSAIDAPVAASVDADHAAQDADLSVAMGFPAPVGAAPVVQRAPRDDWAPTRPDQGGPFTPHVQMSPDTSDVQVALGTSHHHRFTVTDAKIPADADLTWQHIGHGQVPTKEIDLLHEPIQHGRSAEVWIAPKMAGTRSVTTRLIHGPRGARHTDEIATVRFHTPGPQGPTLEKLDAESARGRLPVTRFYQVGEELIVTLHQAGVDGVLAGEHVRASYSGKLPVKSARALGRGRFEVRLGAATAPGMQDGELRVMPYEVAAAEVAPLPLAIEVRKMDDAHDFGGDGVSDQGRPRNFADALTHLEREMAGVFDRRKHAIDTLLLQHAEKDPPPATPLWKELLLQGCSIALGAVTAGLGARLADSIKGLADHAGLKETLKVFSEQSMNAAIQIGWQKATANSVGPRGAAVSDTTPQLGLRAYFHRAQTEALSAMQVATVGGAVTSTGSRAAEVEARSPGDGVRMIMGLTDHFRALAPLAHDQQYVASFQALATQVAHGALPGNDAAAARRKGDRGAAQDGLDLSTELGLDNAVRHEEQQPDPLVTSTRTVSGHGMNKVAGILRLTLAPRGPIAVAGGIGVTRAQLDGFDNDALVATIAGIPVRDLAMPLVARFNVDADTGAMIGRNEAGTYSGNFSPGLARRIAGSDDPVAAARHVIEISLGGATPGKVERG